MNNTIEFVVKMRDMMGGSLGRLSATAQSSFGSMAQHANAMTRRNEVLGMSFNELQNKIRQVENTIRTSTITSQISAARRELAALHRQSAGHAGRPLDASAPSSGGLGIGGIAVGTMLGNVGMMAVGAIGSGISAAITKSMEKEQAITGLTTFLGKDGANEAYKNIRQDADVTPFDTASLLEVNRSLISAGINAKDARSDTMNLANAVSAVGGGNDELSRMAANMQQIKTTGKATSVDIRQFGIAGINIYAMLAKSTGKSIAQAKEMEVTYEQLSKALAVSAGKGGIYEGALKAQSLTKGGKWSTVKDKMGNAASEIGDAFSPLTHKLLDLGIKFAEGIGPGLEKAKPFIDIISNGLGKAVDFVTGLINGTSEWSSYVLLVQDFWVMIWGYVKNIGLKVWSLVSSVVDFIKKSQFLKDVFSGVFSIVKNIAEFLLKTLGFLIDGLAWLWENVLKPILNGIEKAYRWLKGSDDIKISATKTILVPKKPIIAANGQNSNIQTANTLAASNNSSGKTAGDTVSGGGPKVVNINLGKFFDSIQFTTLNSGETAQELEKVVTECLARVLYNGSKLV